MTNSFGDASPSVYRREMLFKYISSSILSLSHAAQRIDTCLMSPEEAVLEAVKSEQHDWLNKLEEDYSCCIPDALVLAAKKVVSVS
jgi:predicted house-cleaning NTP pyrophosphatase (Maf/HAM1 superfamily)